MTVTLRVRSVGWFVLGAVVTALLMVVLAARSAGAAPGDDDSTFVPTAPCRLFDFRPGEVPAGGKKTPLAAGEANVHIQQVTGSVGDCVVPPDAVSVSMNVTIAGPTAQSHLRMFPADEATPNASSLNWLPGQSPTPNKVDVKLSPDGEIKLFNLAGTVNVLADVVGYHTDSSLTELDQRLAVLQGRIDALESQSAGATAAQMTALQGRVDELEAKLADVTIEQIDGHPTVRFTGVNVQIVDGSGTTDGTSNGRGNLVVGYNEDIANPAGDEERTGSHNLVLGVDNDYTAYAGIVAGEGNTISAGFATITGGRFNRASGQASSVSGGFANFATGATSSVSGGSFNNATGGSSSVSGGRSGTASGGVSSVSGGEANTASGLASSVSGGDDNIASGLVSSVSGGEFNVANNDFAYVGGGFNNEASGPRAVVSGGADNIASGSKATVSGGSTRTSASTFDWRAGTLFEDE